MLLRNDLLNPISPDRPAGENLWYSPTYDKIKEARREDDDAPQGEWRRERKVADWQLTIKLIGEALATQTKDLQLAAWLAEAILRREGIAGFRECLDLIRGLLENFWDGLYPELEDGDAEFRASPLRWLGERNDNLELAIRTSPITSGGYGWIRFRESREVGSEASVADNYEKQRIRQEKIDEGKITEEQFDKDFQGTPKKFYVELEQTFTGALDSLSQLSQLCDEKFGKVSPSFRQTQEALEEVRQTVRILLNKKRETEPDAPTEAAAAGAADPLSGGPAPSRGTAGTAVAPAKRPAIQLSAEIRGWDDAVEQVVAAARYMRQQNPYNPASYLMLRALRWGELRAAGKTIDPTNLGAPPFEIRQKLRRLALEANWTEVLETAETTMGMECGRGWLDLQRYFARACSELGGYFEPVRRAVIAELKTLLEEYPKLPELTMMDDMPTANAETLAWLRKQVGIGGSRFDDGSPASAVPRSVELAIEAARAGRPEAGAELLMREAAREPSGRGRFQRKIQLAQLAMAAENEAVALPMLQNAAGEIEQRKLEEWEAGEMLACPLSLLYTCLVKADGSSEERERLHALIWKLNPLEAMKLER
jgi:type VI secretion system protein ImpA